MIAKLKSLFHDIFFAGYEPVRTSSSSASKDVKIIDNIPIYPPIDQGVPVYKPETLLATQQEMIDRIFKTAGLEPAEFKERYLPLLTNLAKYANLLPATKTSHHRGAGGLFRLTLEMGLFSLQSANSTIFLSKSSASAELRFRQHPRWVLATFIAAVCSELYRPIANMIITNDRGDKWPQFLKTLFDWAQETGTDRFFITWNEQDELDVISANQASAAFVINSLVPQTVMQYLNEDGNEVISTMSASITNSVPLGNRNQIHQIVQSIKKKVVEKDIKANSERYGDYIVGAHLEPHLIDAMRQLFKKRAWEFNNKGARVWHSAEGVFIIWKPAVKEITAILKEQGLSGIPSDMDSLADILLTTGVLEENDDEGRYWDICLPTNKSIFSCVKVNRIELIFGDEENLPVLEEKLLVDGTLSMQGAPTTAGKYASLKQPVDKPASEGNSSKAPEKTEKAAKPEDKSQNQLLIESKNKLESRMAEMLVQKEQAKVATEASEERSAPSAKDSSPREGVEKDAEKNQTKYSNRADGNNSKGGDVVEPHSDSAAATYAAGERGVVTGRPSLTQEAESLLASLQKVNAEYLKAILEDHLDGCSTGAVFPTPEGMAITVEELNAHGQANFVGLMTALATKNWLWVDQERPLKKLHDLQYEGATVKAVVITKHIALQLGFKWKKKKK